MSTDRHGKSPEILAALVAGLPDHERELFDAKLAQHLGAPVGARLEWVVPSDTEKPGA